MKRRYGSGKLRVRSEHREDINPMEGVANLVDAMLVLACGLMLALIINWNVDVGSAGTTVELDQEQEVTPVSGITGDGELAEFTGGYEEMGMLYRDPETGKLYMIKADTARDTSGE